MLRAGDNVEMIGAGGPWVGQWTVLEADASQVLISRLVPDPPPLRSMRRERIAIDAQLAARSLRKVERYDMSDKMSEGATVPPAGDYVYDARATWGTLPREHTCRCIRHRMPGLTMSWYAWSCVADCPALVPG